MKNTTELLLDIIDDAFDRIGWQGPMNLKNTIEQLTLEQLIYNKTTEGYCAWQIVLHCAYWKWVVAGLLSDSTPADFPRAPKDFPTLPEEPNESDWKKDFNLLLEQHMLVRKAVLQFPEEKWFEITKPPHDPMTYIKRVYGLAAHDVYHTAQIRNMGIPGIK
jgi:hypothetical protein